MVPRHPSFCLKDWFPNRENERKGKQMMGFIVAAGILVAGSLCFACVREALSESEVR